MYTCDLKDALLNGAIGLYLFATLVWGNMSSTRIIYYASAAILTVVVILLRIRTHKVHYRKYYASYAFLLLISILSGLSVDQSNTIEQCVSISLNFLFASAVINTVVERKQSSNYLKVICVVGIMMSIYVLIVEGVEKRLGSIFYGQRLGKNIGNENVLGYFAVLSTVIAMYYIRYLKRKVFYLALPINVFIVFATGSRMAIVLLLVGGVGIFAINMSYRNVLIVTGRIVFVIGLLLIILNIPVFQSAKARLYELINLFGGKTSDRSLSNRKIMLERGIASFLGSPFKGVGLGNTGSLLSSYMKKEYFYLHNNYIELLASIGVFGFLAYYSVYYLGLRNVIQSDQGTPLEKKLVIMLMVLSLLNDISNVTYYRSLTYFLLYMPFTFKGVYRRKIGLLNR